MVTQQQVTEFEKVRDEIIALLGPREIFDVVPYKLYLSKAGTWEVRFDMSGYSLEKPTIHRLLTEFVYAVSGFLATETDLRTNNADIIVLSRLTETIREALVRLQGIKKP